MGQYYKVLAQVGNSRKSISTYLDGEYQMAKLMEQSWLGNYYVDTIASMFYKKKGRVAWVGDYADDSPYYSQVWNEEKNLVSDESLKKVDFSLDNKFLCNHDSKIYVDLEEYKKASAFGENKDWIIHPLPLLTAQGNGRGGGDYYDNYPNFDKVGDWAMELISIEDEIPEGYDRFDIFFKEGA